MKNLKSHLKIFNYSNIFMKSILKTAGILMLPIPAVLIGIIVFSLSHVLIVISSSLFSGSPSRLAAAVYWTFGIYIYYPFILAGPILYAFTFILSIMLSEDLRSKKLQFKISVLYGALLGLTTFLIVYFTSGYKESLNSITSISISMPILSHLISSISGGSAIGFSLAVYFAKIRI